MGNIFNGFCEEIICTNYGNGFFTLLGRDIAVFIIGYITHLVVESLIELVRIRNDNNHRNFNTDRSDNNNLQK